MDRFLVELADILDIETVKKTDVLDDMADWDSLAKLSVLALASSNYGFMLLPEDLATVHSVKDLWNIFAEKKGLRDDG